MTDSAFETIAREHCAKLLNSRAGKRCGADAEALVILAFTFGAAWALDRPDMLELGNAQIEAMRSEKQ
jgi:hypothetical protein